MPVMRYAFLSFLTCKYLHISCSNEFDDVCISQNNWDIIENKYPLSNACGQLEQSYQDYVCPEGMEHMQCEVDPNMELKASTTAMWYGAPGETRKR